MGASGRATATFALELPSPAALARGYCSSRGAEASLPAIATVSFCEHNECHGRGDPPWHSPSSSSWPSSSSPPS
eukprot:4120332-Pyramimonas_sp.AAC.1